MADQPQFVLSGVDLPGQPNLLGLWDISPGAVSFVLGAEAPPAEPTWTVQLPDDPQQAEAQLAAGQETLRRTLDALEDGDARLERIAERRQQVSFAALELPEPEANLLLSLQQLEEGAPDVVSYGLLEDIEGQFRAFLEQVGRLVSDYARAETRVKDLPIARTTVNWSGDFNTAWLTELNPALMRLHADVLQLTLDSRMAVVRMLAIVAAHALALAPKISAGPILALPALLRFLWDVIKEAQKAAERLATDQEKLEETRRAEEAIPITLRRGLVREDTSIHFALTPGEQEAADFTYLPFGTRTLRLRVIPTGEIEDTVRLRPAATARWRDGRDDLFLGYADRGDLFQITWGDGEEEGLPVRAGEETTLFFNLTHLGPEVPDETTLTLVADSGRRRDEQGREEPLVVARKALRLRPPADREAARQAYRLAWQGEELISAGGSAVPHYLSRWWPAAQVTYYAAPESRPPPQLVCKLAPGRSDRLLVYLRSGEELTALGAITDNRNSGFFAEGRTRGELYALEEEGVWVLRLWFFWQGREAGAGPWYRLPDQERMDILFDADFTPLPYLACVDLDWRETWAEVPKEGESPAGPGQPPLEAEIGMNLGDKAGELWDKIAEVLSGRDEGLSYPYNPLANVRARAGQRTSAVTVAFAPGWLPQTVKLRNVAAQDPLLISSDVRQEGGSD
jgi:hypothetical protein